MKYKLKPPKDFCKICRMHPLIAYLMFKDNY